MKTIARTSWGQTHPISFIVNHYANNNNLSINMITTIDDYPEPFSFLTVNLNEKCAENCAFIDVNNNGPDIIDWLIDNKLGKLSGKIKQSGFCIYPEFIFDLNEIKNYICE